MGRTKAEIEAENEDLIAALEEVMNSDSHDEAVDIAMDALGYEYVDEDGEEGEEEDAGEEDDAGDSDAEE